MKKVTAKMLSLAVVAGLLVVMGGIAAAAAATPSRDASKLNAEITMLNADVRLPQGEKIISKHLSDTFKIDSSRISSLTARNMQYGDIAAILAFAEKIPGGVTEANINRVASMRSSATGWDELAKSLNVKISDVASRLSTIEDTAHRNIKQAYAASLAAGAGAGGMTGESSDDIYGGAPGGSDEDIYGGESTQAPGGSGY